MHLGISLLIDLADLTAGMLLVHAYTFDPDWIRLPRSLAARSVNGCARLERGVPVRDGAGGTARLD